MRTEDPPRRNDRGWRGGRFGPGPRRTVRRRGQLGARPSYMPARGRRGGGFPIWLGILLLIALGVILWLFLKGDAFQEDPGTSSGSTGAEAPAQTGSGTITVGGDDLLGLAGEGNDALVDREGEEVVADGVIVQAVVGDEAFWVGTDLDRRVLVAIDTGGGSAPSVQAGDRVSFRGTVEPLPLDFADRYGIAAGGDTDLLMAQGHFVRATDVTQA